MMKKIALVAALAAIAAPAFAQSSVTLYGRVNTTVESQKVENQGRKVVVQNNSSRIGFRGVEDMGGGLKASFELEHGFNSDTGAATGGTAGFWGRGAHVQIAGAFGAVRLGRWTPGSYYATADYIGMHNHDTGTSSDALYGGPFPTANKVGYFYSTGGFSTELAVAAGEGSQPRAFDASANYDQGPLHLGAGYSKQSADKQFAVRGLYELGAVTLGAYYQHVTGAGNTKENNLRFAAAYAIGASSFHLDIGRATEAKTNQWTLGYNYNLSKRTKLYGFYTAIDTKLAAQKGDFSSFAAGVRHNF
ncbi:porin [Paucibacter soli]|uniref:porin n=1 Tax=Paucibacter soli TaxID=3133433 RepID=UPI0030B385CD